METNQGKDQETDTQIQGKHSPAPTGLAEKVWRRVVGRRVELQMPLESGRTSLHRCSSGPDKNMLST